LISTLLVETGFLLADCVISAPDMDPSMHLNATPARSTSPGEENGDAGARVNEADPPSRTPATALADNDNHPRPAEVSPSTSPAKSVGNSVSNYTPKNSPDMLSYKSIKKSSPLKHVTPILKKYSAQRKAKSAKRAFCLSIVNAK